MPKTNSPRRAKRKRLRVVNLIPTYNEKENILRLLKALTKIKKQHKKYEFYTLVVDDNSPDGTGEIARKYRKSDRTVCVLTGEKKGLGVAMVRGILYARDTLKADVVIPNEADFAYSPSKIPFILSKIEEGYDFVVASRHVQGGGTRGWTFSRRVNHFVANKFFATWVAGVYEVKDHNGACRAIKGNTLKKLDFDTFPTKGFSFFSYLTYSVIETRARIHEFPVTYKFRTKGESKVSFNSKYFKTYLRDIAEFAHISLRIRWEKTLKQKNIAAVLNLKA